MFSLHLSQRKKWICTIVPCIMLLGIAAWYFTPQSSDSHEREVVKIDQAIKTTAATKIVQNIYYEKCRDTEQKEVSIKADEIGLGYVDFLARYPGWNVELFDVEQIKMSFLDKGVCPEHQRQKFVGIQGDYVAVFYGTPTKRPILKELTQIQTTALQPQALEEIKKGIPFASNEEMLRILEGMHAK